MSGRVSWFQLEPLRDDELEEIEYMFRKYGGCRQLARAAKRILDLRNYIRENRIARTARRIQLAKEDRQQLLRDNNVLKYRYAQLDAVFRNLLARIEDIQCECYEDKTCNRCLALEVKG